MDNQNNYNQNPMGEPQQGGSFFEPNQGSSDATNVNQFGAETANSFGQDVAQNQGASTFNYEGDSSAAFNQPVQSYNQPAQDYTQPTGFNQPAQDYSQPMQGYGQPVQDYSQPVQDYSQPAQDYNQPMQPAQPDYSQTGYQQPVGYDNNAANNPNQFNYTPQQNYNNAPGGTDTRPTNTMAIISVIAGGLSCLLALIGIMMLNIIVLIVAILAGIAGIVLGSMAGKEITANSPTQGKSLATAGLVTGIVGAGLALLVGVSCYACVACTLSSIGSMYY